MLRRFDSQRESMAFFQPTEVRSRHLVSPVCLEDNCLHVSGSKLDPSESFKDPTLALKKLMAFGLHPVPLCGLQPRVRDRLCDPMAG